MMKLLLENLAKSSRLVLLGPPCCGKGTLAQRLVTSLDLPHISTGEIFRSHLREGTSFGEEIEQSMQEGRLVPDQLVTDLTLRELRTLPAGFILDGFPRTVSQANELHKDFKNLTVIHLHVSDEIVTQRLSGRISCGSCGSVFNNVFCPPKEEGVCDNCHDQLVHRSDDTKEVVTERLRQYHKHSKPVVDLYKELGLLTTVEAGDLKPDQIFQRVVESTDS